MKPKGTPYTVDFYTEGFPVPQPGDVVLDVSHTQAVRGYFRVLASRQVKVRVSRGEVARFVLRIQRLTALPDGAQVALKETRMSMTPPARDGCILEAGKAHG